MEANATDTNSNYENMYEAKGNIDLEGGSLGGGSAFKKIGRGIYDIIETLVIALAVVVFLYLFIASPHEVVGRSMEENFFNGQYLLSDKISYKFKDPVHGDVVIFKETETQDYIKRVIGVGGDTVEIRDGKIYLNGEILDESEYLDADVYTDGGAFLDEGTVYTVPEGKYFVCGDNRPHSSDSRTFGPIEKSVIKGRAILIYWPFSDFEVLRRPSYGN